MKRRQVLKGALVGLGGAACSAPLVASFFGVRRYDPREGLVLEKRWDALNPVPAEADLAAFREPGVTDSAAVRALMRRAVAALGGMGRFVSPGDRVYIKPNIGWARRPELAATTNPDVVAELVQLALEAGAGRVDVGDRTCEEPGRCYDGSRIGPAAREVGGRLIHAKSFTEVRGEGRATRAWLIDDNYLAADRVINVAVAKHHMLSGATLTMKNLFGILGGERSRLHQMVHETIAELGLLFKPTLSVVDGIRVMTANGPTGGSLDYVRAAGAVVAGIDPVAVDTFALRELFRERYGGSATLPRFIPRAVELGAGSSDLDAARIVAEGFGG